MSKRTRRQLLPRVWVSAVQRRDLTAVLTALESLPRFLGELQGQLAAIKVAVVMLREAAEKRSASARKANATRKATAAPDLPIPNGNQHEG